MCRLHISPYLHRAEHKAPYLSTGLLSTANYVSYTTLYDMNMILSDEELLHELRTGELVLTPFHEEDLQPASIDMHLADGLQIPDPAETALDPLHLPAHYTRQVHGRYYLRPGEFVLGSTVEQVTLSSRLAARFEGKSSLGRLGLAVHITAGFIDPGFSGNITLELHNVAPYNIILTPGMPIGQLCVVAVRGKVLRPYGAEELGSRYQGQMGATASRGVIRHRT